MKRTKQEHGQCSDLLLAAFSSLVQARAQVHEAQRLIKKAQKETLDVEVSLTEQRLQHALTKVKASMLYHNDAAHA